MLVGRGMLANTISLTLISSFLIPPILYYGTYDLFYMKLFAGLFAANIAVEGIKPLVGSGGWRGRPDGAIGCDAFCKGGAVGGRPGFPSGHMTNVSMLVSALWWHTGSPIVLWVGVPWVCAMAWSRWAKHCHNWQQITAGTIFGLLCGTGLATAAG